MFRHSPWKLFTAGATGWFVFTLGYSVAGMFFDNLHSRLNITAFHMFLLGAGCYAVVSVALWVGETAKRAIEHLPANQPARDRAAPPNG
jgi:hypothetical protein